jgi:hypothetical protein
MEKPLSSSGSEPFWEARNFNALTLDFTIHLVVYISAPHKMWWKPVQTYHHDIFPKEIGAL